VRPARDRAAGCLTTVGGIGVVVNPHAKGNRTVAPDRERRMVEILGRDGLVRVTPDLPGIEEVAREFVAREIDILAVCGGDGSDHCTLTAFHKIYDGRPLPLLLPLRAGTINYIADATSGRRGTPEQVLARVVRDHRRGNTHVTTERDVIRVNGTELGFLLSFGTTVNFLRAYYALDEQGPWAAAKLLGRMMTSAMFGTHISRAVFQAVEADIECDGELLPFRLFTFFFASTVDRIALGFRPTYLALRKRGYFHVLGGPIAARRLVRRAVRVYRGFPTGEPDLYDSLGRRLAVRFARPTHIMLDGDILDAVERCDVEVAFRVSLVCG
jgi:diacylglycerol kinase family enzyme